MTEDEWRNLYENFETTWLLEAVDHVDNLRGYLGDGDYFEPPEIRTNLLKLHGIAMNVVNNGWDSQLGEMAELTDELEMQASEMLRSLRAVQQTLRKLTALLPEDAFDIDG